jgi:hypothetical protein
VPLALEGAEEGLESGDMLFACFNLSSYVIYRAVCGEPMQDVIGIARAHLDRNAGLVMNARFHLILEMQYAKALAGMTSDPLSLSDDEFDETRDLSSICETELANQIGYYLVAKLKQHVLFADWAGAASWARKADDLLPAFEGQVAEFEFVQYKTLAALQRATELAQGASYRLIDEALQGVEQMQIWASLCPDNFEHKAHLLRAVHADVSGDFSTAQKHFELATELAEANGFPMDSALAHEFWGRMLLGRGAREACLDRIRISTERYASLGADAKCEHLRQEFAVGSHVL